MQSTIKYLLIDNLLAILHVWEHIQWTNRIDAVEKCVANELKSSLRLHHNFDHLRCKAERKGSTIISRGKKKKPSIPKLTFQPLSAMRWLQSQIPVCQISSSSNAKSRPNFSVNSGRQSCDKWCDPNSDSLA